MGKRESNHFSSSTPEDEAGGSAPERLVVRMAQESNGRRELLRSLGAWGTQYKTAALTVWQEANAWNDERVHRVQASLEARWPYVAEACWRPFARLQLSSCEDRRSDPALALAYLVFVAGVCKSWPIHSSPCEVCLQATGNWCEYCDEPNATVCTVCEAANFSRRACSTANRHVSSEREPAALPRELSSASEREQHPRQGILQRTRSNTTAAGQSKRRWPHATPPDGFVGTYDPGSSDSSDAEASSFSSSSSHGV